jgi:hypothetical protein
MMIGEKKRKTRFFRRLLLVSRSLLAASSASFEAETKASLVSTPKVATSATSHRNFLKRLFEAAFDRR